MDKNKPVKGRGRGRVRDVPDPRPPRQSTLDSLRNEPVVSQPTPEQFSNATSVAESTAPIVTENISTNDNMNRDTSKTTIAEGKSPPMVAELKEKVQRGVQVAQSLPSTTTIQLTKLSVDAVPFTLSNGPATELELAPPASLMLSSLPMITKQAPSSTANTVSKLNPNSPEFNPNPKGWNVAAPVFVPSVSLPMTMQNGEGQLESDDDVPSFGPMDIVKGFTPVAVVEDLENEPVIKAAAEMLVKGAMFVASFDRLKTKLQTAMKTFPPSDDILANLAEMIVQWGVSEPYFRYTACTICETLCDEEKVNTFHKNLIRRLMSWYKKHKYLKMESEEEKYYYINFALFCAEIFSRIKVVGKPMEVIADKVFEFVNTLLALKTDEMVIGACNILKLTGALLEQSGESGSMAKMDQVMEVLKTLALDKSLSRSCIDVLMRVMTQRAQNWMGMSTKPLPSMESPPTKGVKPLNIDAKPFVPSGDFQIQQPVSSVEEWNEFETDYGDITDEGVVYDFTDGGFDEDGLDPDIELEMEAFIDEMEEHLRMQDFDPEIEAEFHSDRQ